MALVNRSEGLVPYLRNSLAQVLDQLKQWNTPVAQLGTIAGVGVKPWHLALAGVAIIQIAQQIKVAIAYRKSEAAAAQRRADLDKQILLVPQLDTVRPFSEH